MEKKQLYVPFRILVILVVITLSAACGGGDRETPIPFLMTPVSQDEPMVLGDEQVIYSAIFEWERATYNDLLEAFEEANPGIRVELVSINEILGFDPMGGRDWPSDAESRLLSAADVVNLIVSPETIREGLVRDLAPFIEAEPDLHLDDFYTGTLESYQWDGGIWALPTDVNFPLIFFDKDAFDEAGVPYPEMGWSWDDFVATAKTLTTREMDQAPRWGFVQSWPGHLPFIEGRVGPLIDNTTDPPTVRFDQPEVIEAVRWYTDLYRAHGIVPYLKPAGPTAGLSPSPEQSLIDDGQAAMWPDHFTTWQWHNEQRNVGVVPYPVDAPDSRTTPVWTPGLSMSASAIHPDAAWSWINYLSQQVATDLGRQSLPARRSVAKASGFWDDLDEELAGALRYAMNHSYEAPQAPGYKAFSDAVEVIIRGEKSAEDALAGAQGWAEAQQRR